LSHEYESVLLAALLHDIGKFCQRGITESAGHWKMSEAFVEANRHAFSDPDLVKDLVGHHHEAYNMPSDAKPSALTDPRRRILAYLVSRADSLSSRERSEGERAEGFQSRAPLDSVFAQVRLGRSDVSDYDGSGFKYQLGKLYEFSSFPELREPGYQHDKQTYEHYMDMFCGEFKQLFHKPFDGMVDSLTSLLHKYLWCVPSDTTQEMRDVSLSDHLKSTCALAACMYKYHEEVGWDEELVKDDEAPRFLLVCGDISGIQKYIYGIASVGHGGVAKRLRGRSFRISLLTEAVALRLLKELGLPQACKIIAAGGQFYLILPNTESAKKAVEGVRKSISSWMLEEFCGELAVSMAYAEFNGAKLAQGEFDHVLQEVRQKIARAKQRKFEDVIVEGEKVFDLEFQGAGVCPVCGINPSRGVSEPEGPLPCDCCEQDSEIGTKLISAGWLVFSEQQGSNAVAMFEDPVIYASLASDEAELRRLKPIMSYSLKGATLVSEVPCGFAPYAGYVARWKGLEEYNEAVARNSRIAEYEDYSDEALRSGQAVKSFTALAYQSRGAKLLGVLRADVDHLGLIFTMGLKGKASLSRLATLSTMMNTFFAHELVKMVEREFPDTYVAYAGGDDLMLVGPWDQTLKLAKRISDDFKRFAASNPDITISAGIGTFKHRVPIATTSVLTGEILEAAKDAGRNRLSVFGTTFTWDRYDDVERWTERLISGIESDTPISKGFLYNLLDWQEKAELYYSGRGDGRTAMFRPHLAYAIGRLLTDDEGRPRIDDELYRMLMRLLQPEGKDDWKILKAPITWASYAVRKED
jgi:CRISPR-associated protein Csm1